MQIELIKSQNGAKADLLVVFSTQTKKGTDTLTKITHPELHKRLAPALQDKMITGKAKEAVLYREFNPEPGFRHLLVVGLGASSNVLEQVRQAAAAAQKAAASTSSVASVTIDLDGLPSLNKETMQAFVEGLILASYKFDELKSKNQKIKKRPN